MTKPMAADFNRAVILYRMHLETAGHELSANWCGLAEHLAKVFHRLCVTLDPFIVLIELEVTREEGLEPGQVTLVERREEG